MTELLTAQPQSIVIAVLVAIAIDLFRRVFKFAGRKTRRFWFGSAPKGLETGWVAELCSYFLFPVLAFFAFVFSLVVLVATATLMGFDPHVRIAALAHGTLLLWSLVVLFLWVQIWHVMSLPGFWQRVRYVLLLFALPLTFQVIAWIALDCLFRAGFADTETLKLVSLASRLACVGLVPFLMPLLHARILAPVFEHLIEITPARWRRAVVVAGSVTLAGLVVFAAWSVGEASRRILFARSELAPSTGTTPVSIGVPHTCRDYYPAFSRRIGEEGTAIVAFHIATTGSVKDVVIVRSSGSPRLDLASVLCATHWTYLPAIVHGQPVERPWKAEIVWKMR